MTRNCAFQYAVIIGSIFRNTKIVCDKTELTLEEAIALWEKYYPEAAKHINNGNQVEMVIWIDMEHKTAYGKTLHYISTDAESDGINIWEMQRNDFPAKIKL